jgi:uncharacterized membrane protein YedE/YeeE
MIAAFPNAQPVAGFAGGLLIGLAAALMLLGLGRIAGVSGLAARALGISSSGAPRHIALAFVLGIPFGAGLLSLVYDIETHFPPSFSILIGAGLLVGFGTRLGSGCTSGHGVCGLSRLSPRSIVATLLFLTSGVVTATLIRLLGGS